MRYASVTNRATRRGTAVVEFALVAPLLFMLIFGIIEFGRMLMVQQVITNAAREGSRYVVLPGSSNSSVESRVADVLTGTGVSGYGVAITPSDITQADADDPISVTVDVPYKNVSWVTGFLPLEGRIMSASCVMRKESTGS